MKRWWRDSLLPLPHHRHLLDSYRGALPSSRVKRARSWHGPTVAGNYSNAQPGTSEPFVVPHGGALTYLELGPVPSLRMHVGGDPLGGLSGLALGGPLGEVWEASLPPDFVLDAVSWARDRLLGQTVG